MATPREQTDRSAANTGLDRGLRKGGGDRLGKAFQPVHDGDQHVLNVGGGSENDLGDRFPDERVAPVVPHRKPEFGPFILRHPFVRKTAPDAVF